MTQYSCLNKAQLSYDYLHTNSGGYMIAFADNGVGMSPDEAKNVIMFGKSKKKNALGKSIGIGSMRIGNDMIIFTKRDNICTCLLLSRTFHESEKLKEVIVPLPSFNDFDMTPHHNSIEDAQRHELEIEIILKHSPFKTQRQLLENFTKISGQSGTVVIIYNLKLTSNGGPELDIKSTKDDILLVNYEDKEDVMDCRDDYEIPAEKKSLRAYVSILYADPRMKVYIRGRKVRTKRLLSTLTNVMRYEYTSKTFKSRVEAECAKAKAHVKTLEHALREAESKVKDYETRMNPSENIETLKNIRKLNMEALEIKEELANAQEYLNKQNKSLKEPKMITFYFGLNIQNRAADGMFVYNSTRLIKMYQRIGPQQDSSMMCRGVMGLVDVPYMILEPTHNKQDFADAKEYRMLLRAMADHLMQYWDDLNIESQFTSPTSKLNRTALTQEEFIFKFWKSYGYFSAKWRDPPSSEEKYIRKRTACLQNCVQCNYCLKWRILPATDMLSGKEINDNWQCSNNSDPKHNKCEDPEEDLNPQLGVLRRKIKSKEQRQNELANQIKKKQEELEKIRVVEEDNEVESPRNTKKNTLRKKDDNLTEEENKKIETNRSKPLNEKKSDFNSLLDVARQNEVNKKRNSNVTQPKTLPVKKSKTEPARALTVADKKAAQRTSIENRKKLSVVSTDIKETRIINDDKPPSQIVPRTRRSARFHDDPVTSDASEDKKVIKHEDIKPNQDVVMISISDSEDDQKITTEKTIKPIIKNHTLNGDSINSTNDMKIVPKVALDSTSLSTESGQVEALCKVVRCLVSNLLPPDYKHTMDDFNSFSTSELISYNYNSMVAEYNSTMNMCFNQIRDTRDHLTEAGKEWIQLVHDYIPEDKSEFRRKITELTEEIRDLDSEKKRAIREIFKQR